MKIGDIVHVIEHGIEDPLPAIVTALRNDRADVVRFGADGATVLRDIETAASAVEGIERENAQSIHVAVPIGATKKTAPMPPKDPAP